MAEFVIKLADERGHIQEQTQTASSAEELRSKFTTAGYYVYSVKPRGFTGKRKKAKLESLHHLQRAVPHPRPRRPAHPRLARDARQAAEEPQLRRPAAKRRRASAHRRIDLRRLRGPGRIPHHLHHHPARRRTLRQPRRGAQPLPVLPAHLAQLPQEAAGLAGLSRAVDGHGRAALHLPHHLRRAPVRQTLRLGRHQAARAHPGACSPSAPARSITPST